MKQGRKISMVLYLFIVMQAALLPYADHAVASPATLSTGQSIYVAVYSHIYHGNTEKPFDLTATLSIRNTDPHHPVKILSADYIDSDGNLIKKYMNTPHLLSPLASMRHVIKSTDKSGGSGANFIVRWTSGHPVNPPLVEAIMISTRSSQGISFVSRGVVLIENQ